MVRDPVRWLISEYKQYVQSRNFDRILEEIVFKADHSIKIVNADSSFVMYSMYSLILESGLDHFPRENIHILEYDQLVC